MGRTMRVFVAGASGVIGVRLVPLLVAAGYHVAGMTRTRAKAQLLRDLGAEAVVCDVFDREALDEAVNTFAPDVVIHQLTDLPDDPARISQLAAANARIRREGTRNLLRAAQAAGTGRFIAQSVAWQVPGDGGAAVADHEQRVLEAGGVVIRYGRFYGPDTFYPDQPPPPPRVSLDEAARRTVPALDAPSGVVVIAEPTGMHAS